jgi:hypothetical protein
MSSFLAISSQLSAISKKEKGHKFEASSYKEIALKPIAYGLVWRTADR